MQRDNRWRLFRLLAGLTPFRLARTKPQADDAELIYAEKLRIALSAKYGGAWTCQMQGDNKFMMFIQGSKPKD